MLTNYIKIAWKVLLRHPFYTFITLFGISLTLTVLMVLTSFLDHLIGSHYPEYKRDRSLYLLHIRLTDSTNRSGNMSDFSYKFLKQHVFSLKTPEKVAMVSTWAWANSYVDGKRIKVKSKFSDANFWDVTDFTFLEGKPYSEQNIANADPVAVITDAFRTDYFGLNTNAVGKTIEVDNARYRVIGVVKAAPITRLFSSAEVYLPYTLPKSNYQKGEYLGSFNAIILARNQRDFKAIQDEYNQSVKRIPIPFMEGNWLKVFYIRAEAKPYLDTFIQNFPSGPNSTTVYTVITLIMLLFMLLPAINLVNLNVGRSMERASEIGVRKAFGAPVRTLLGQFVIENVFITLLGGLIALGLSALILSLINQSGWILHSDLTINLSVLAVSIFLCLIFGILSGVIPAWRMAKLPIADALKS
ncbi:ABC transporter permease [Spirosoma montaniterrae]|uniref:ABC transporter permease n=1 Tax=Spirosoma montaniterrae TaxID=1178516 RepID=A0A1P9WS14_9BACT|nr:ABC transporter permease [Spirosoma montaniterrae]AQG78133.1 ABC transporter permease [Spirosoma montaniterrae]